MSKELKYKRVLIKISGEALAPDVKGVSTIFDAEKLKKTCCEIANAADTGCQIAVVIGAGNIWRGKLGMDIYPTEADSMGMLATVINSIAVKSTLENMGRKVKLYTSVPMPTIGPAFNAVDAIKEMESGSIVIVGGGTGNPFFTTDTAIILRALELSADVALFAKNVPYLYNRDPRIESDEPLFKYIRVNFSTVLREGLAAIDLTASAMCKERGMDICLFKLNEVDFSDIITGKVEPSTFISEKIKNDEIVTMK